MSERERLKGVYVREQQQQRVTTATTIFGSMCALLKKAKEKKLYSRACVWMYARIQANFKV